MLADTPEGEHALRLIESPTRVALEEGELLVEAADEPATRVRFRAAGAAAGAAGAGLAPAAERRESGLPGGGQGRTDEVGQVGGVYPASGGMRPPGDTPAQPPASFGQRDRGAAGYDDAGESGVVTMPPEGGEDRSGT